jgi:3-phosphoshikimate 1-carboxyvinyltransferase
MKVTINKTAPKGRVTIPSSKSMTLRALFCAALARGESQIQHPLISDDTSYAADVLGKIGVTIQDVDGVWHVGGGHFKIPAQELNCGESATTLRLMTALVALLPGTIKLTGAPSLNQRPIRALVDALKMVGVKGATEGNMTPPVTIVGGTFKGGTAEIAGNISSQYISALLLIGAFAPAETIIRLTTPLTSRPYILMTLQVLRKFNISVRREGNSFIVKRQRFLPATINVEGDWSSASYFLALGVLSEEGITLENLSTSSRQGDRVILDHLRNMGAHVAVTSNTITVKKGEEELKAIHTDLSDCIDLLPTMAMLAALAKGESELRGIQRARIKESNRVSAVREGLTKLGVQVQEFREYITIKGLNTDKKVDDDSGTQETMLEKPEDFYQDGKGKPAITINSYNDHRVAMAFAIMGVALGGIAIKNAECVSKTYPGFWEDLTKLGGDIKIDEQ